MTDLDPHLKQALRQAPDRNLQPNPSVQTKVLQHAQRAVQSDKRAAWISRIFRSSQWNWQAAGLSSAALALLALVVIRHAGFDTPSVSLPTELIQQNNATAPMASADSARVKQESAKQPAKRNSLKQDQPSSLAVSKPKQQRAAPTDDTQPAEEDKLALAEAAVASTTPTPAPVETPATPQQATLSGQISDTRTQAEITLQTRNPALPELVQNLLSIGGERLAQQDGALTLKRILQLSQSNTDPSSCRMETASEQDAATGYPVTRLINCHQARLEEEVGRYNAVMRNSMK